MSLPKPEAGLVVRYDFLWARDADKGKTSSKVRPACLAFTPDDVTNPNFVALLPITHSPPASSTVGIEIPRAVCEHLGLDDGRSWIILSEFNIDDWPNAGLQPVPGKRGKFTYGFIPPILFETIRKRFLELVEKGQSRGTRRSP
ncbi:MAG TPA: hypothetical protein VLW75_08040 [Rhizomicrobium sp.]|nr:hypothetical protein [Rhizomicrobium sp.]